MIANKVRRSSFPTRSAHLSVAFSPGFGHAQAVRHPIDCSVDHQGGAKAVGLPAMAVFACCIIGL